MITAEQAVSRYMAGMSSGQATAKYKEGVQAVTESPMEKAASPASMDLYLRKVQESVSSGRRRERLLAVPLERYKNNAIAKADRLASGAKAAADKVRNHFAKWMPIYKNVSDAVKNMPKGGLEEAKARSGKAIEMLMQAAGRS